MFLILIGIITINILIFAYKWLTANNEYFQNKNVPHSKRHLIFGNLGPLVMKKETPAEFIKKIYKHYENAKVYGFFEMRNPVFVLRDLEVIKQITVKDFDHFEDHRTIVDDKMDPLMGNILPSLTGDKWRNMRSTLSPAFTGSKMRLMFDLVSNCSIKAVAHFKTKIGERDSFTIDTKEIFSRFATDVIGTCAFGIEVDSFRNENNEFYLTGQDLISFKKPLAQLKMFLFVVIPAVMKFLRISFVSKKNGNLFRGLIHDTITIREKQNIIRPDMINILMQVRKGQLKHSELEKADDGFATVEESKIGQNDVSKIRWTDDELTAQCFVFFLAGFETTATQMTFIAYELAVNRDVQDKLIQEIDNIRNELGDKPVTYETLQKMEYLDMVISEGLRKWPAAPVTERLCTKDYVLKDKDFTDITIEKGRQIWIPVYAIHHDPKYYPNPDKFDPERFSNENKKNFNVNAYLPFGVGPRNCIGSRFALMEIKTLLYHLLSFCTIEVGEKTAIPLVLAKSVGGLVPEGSVWLELKNR